MAAMTLTLSPTSQLVEVGGTQGRVWEGADEHGTPVQALILRVAVHEQEPAEVHARFAAALLESDKPRPVAKAFDHRFFVD